MQKKLLRHGIIMTGAKYVGNNKNLEHYAEIYYAAQVSDTTVGDSSNLVKA